MQAIHVTKAATNRMLTQKEIDKTVMLRTPRAAFRIFFTDMKILIPTIVAVGLILKSPVSTFLVDNLGVRGYRLVVAIIAGYAAFKFGEAYGTVENRIHHGLLRRIRHKYYEGKYILR